jgi:hypothetical protein
MVPLLVSQLYVYQINDDSKINEVCQINDVSQGKIFPMEQKQTLGVGSMFLMTPNKMV